MRFIHPPRHSRQRPILLTTTLLLILTALISFLRQSSPTILVVETAESANLQGNEYWSLLIGDESSFTDARWSLLTSDGGLLLSGYSQSFGAGGDGGWLIKLDPDGQIQWQKTYGGNKDDYFYPPIETADGNFIAIGRAGSFTTGLVDGWVLKLNQNGDVIWQKAYGTLGYEEITNIIQLNDGGYIFIGGTDPDGNDYFNAWVVRLDSAGNILWEKTFGGPLSDSLTTIRQTADGGFIAAGTYDNTFGINGRSWIVKLNSDGTIDWDYTYSDQAVLRSIHELSDGSFIAGGTSLSDDRFYDAYLIKVTGSGQVIWEKSYGTADFEFGSALQVINDNEFMVAGAAGTVGNGDYWLLKLDGAGNILWQKIYGYSDRDEGAASLQRAANGDLYMVGDSTQSNPGKTFIVKVDSNGNADNCNIIGSYNGNVLNLTNPAVNVNSTSHTVTSTVAPTTAVPENSAEASSFVCGGPSISSLSGRVLDNNSLALPGTEITYQVGGSVTTDAGGYYTITNLLPGNYTLLPTLPGYAFVPGNHAVSVPPDQTNLDFVGTPIIYNSFDFLPAFFKQ
jgi:hypothetical protein